jgi:aminomethyltransferase
MSRQKAIITVYVAFQYAMSNQASLDAAPPQPERLETSLLHWQLSATSAQNIAAYHGVQTVAVYSSAAQELAALLATAGVYDLGWRTHLLCSGDDRVRWLNGMVTNHVGALEQNTGCYAFVLNAQGRIQGDLNIYQRGEALWLETDAPQIAALTAFLEHYIIMDDVVLGPAPAWTRLGIAGPKAAALLQQLGMDAEGLGPQAMREGTWNGTPVLLVAAHGPQVPRFELWCAPEHLAPLWQAMQGAGAIACGSTAIEQLRILEGTPAYGTDITADHLPQETGQERALHFAKGCYLGQEVVERIRSRGQVHRVFTGFVLEAELPTGKSPLLAEGQPVGAITSAASMTLPNGKENYFALGYLRREALDKKSTLRAGDVLAVPSSLPFSWRKTDLLQPQHAQ